MPKRGRKKNWKVVKEGYILEGAMIFRDDIIILGPVPENKEHYRKVRITIEEI